MSVPVSPSSCSVASPIESSLQTHDIQAHTPLAVLCAVVVRISTASYHVHVNRPLLQGMQTQPTRHVIQHARHTDIVPCRLSGQPSVRSWPLVLRHCQHMHGSDRQPSLRHVDTCIGGRQTVLNFKLLLVDLSYWRVSLLMWPFVEASI